ncbi:hypothetical protein BGX28_008920 [Mortierella sp. GBA30]|nr:hypothetical protein BGX28_008920 [Mortierella sp. GBA30]
MVPTDANPTPTRFLLESGAFPPGFVLHLNNYSPFDADLKLLNAETPKTELNPFDSSFRMSSSAVSTQTIQTTQRQQQCQRQYQQEDGHRWRSFHRQAWADVMFDEDALPMPQMSPGLPTSSSSSSPSTRSLSPPLCTVPSNIVSLDHVQASGAPENQSLQTHNCVSPVFGYPVYSKPSCRGDHELISRSSDSIPIHNYQDAVTSQEHGQSELDHPFHMQVYESNDDEDEISQYDADHDDPKPTDQHGNSGMDTTMSELEVQQESGALMESGTGAKITRDSENARTMSNRSTTESRDVTSGPSSVSKPRKSKFRKRASSEEETPENKRLKFLERNRIAAAKCREKKRQQTLKIISDADEITARNQALHETVEGLREEVRRLQAQILCHRDCGCDVIRRFVKTTFEYNNISSPQLSLHSHFKYTCP